tara:strand:- start:368 stop:538 length:171 start_codon:yes stop_codon:yes gene_type:complete
MNKTKENGENKMNNTKEITYEEAMSYITKCENTSILSALSTSANSRKWYLNYKNKK